MPIACGVARAADSEHARATATTAEGRACRARAAAATQAEDQSRLSRCAGTIVVCHLLNHSPTLQTPNICYSSITCVRASVLK